MIDASGRWLLPGSIDDQVHFRDPGLSCKADTLHEQGPCSQRYHGFRGHAEHQATMLDRLQASEAARSRRSPKTRQRRNVTASAHPSS